MWGNQLNNRSPAEKMGVRGKLACATYTQTQVYLKPLLRKLKIKTLPEDISDSLTEITRYMVDRDYIQVYGVHINDLHKAGSYEENFVIAFGLLYPSTLLICKVLCLLPDPIESCFNKHNLIWSTTHLLFVMVLSRAAQIPQFSFLLCTNNFYMYWL